MRLSSSSGGSRGEIWCNYSYRNDHGSHFPKAAREKSCNVLLLFNFPCIFSSSLSPTNSRFELEVAGVTFSDSAPVPKFFNPGPDPEIFHIWESDSCSDSGYSRGNRKLPMVLLQKWPRAPFLMTIVTPFLTETWIPFSWNWQTNVQKHFGHCRQTHFTI